MADEVSFAYRGAGSETGPRRPADRAGLAAGGLIGVSVALGLADDFLGWRLELGRADQIALVLTTGLSLGVLTASAGLVVAGSWPAAASARPDSRPQLKAYGTLLGAGMSALSFCAALDALGGMVAGLYRFSFSPYWLVDLLGWLPGAAGSALLLGRKHGRASVGRPGRPRRADALALALLAITAIGAMVTWGPPWERYTFTVAATGAVQTVALYNEFTAPGALLAAGVCYMLVVVAMAAAAAVWRPARLGAVFLTGAVAMLAEQALAGFATVIHKPSPAMFGISQAQAAAARLTITVTGTSWFWASCGFVAVLIVLHEWLFTRSRPRRQLAAAAAVTPAESAVPDDPVLPLAPREQLPPRRSTRAVPARR